MATTTRQEKIIEALEDFGYLTFSELADEVGPYHLDTSLLALERRDLVARTDDNPPKFYSTGADWLKENKPSDECQRDERSVKDD